MNVTTSEVNPLIPYALSANLAYGAFLGIDGLRSGIGNNAHANMPRSNLKFLSDQISNQTSTCSMEKNYTSVAIEQKIFVDKVLKIKLDNITQQLRELVLSVLNISNASLSDFRKQYGTWDVGTALVVYEEKLRDNTDIFTLAIICCSLALLIKSNNQHKEIEKMNKLYEKSQTTIYESV